MHSKNEKLVGPRGLPRFTGIYIVKLLKVIVCKTICVARWEINKYINIAETVNEISSYI